MMSSDNPENLENPLTSRLNVTLICGAGLGV